VFATGDYVSDFSFQSSHDEFESNVFFRLKELWERLHSRVKDGESESEVAAQIHLHDVMPHFYRNATDRGRGTSAFRSHTACFCCLFRTPEHALPCGHIICTSCLMVYGNSLGPTVVELFLCPIDSAVNKRFHRWRVFLQPRAAGIRILTLDG
jgi:hypothetical protein